MLCAIAVAGVVAAGIAVELALASDQLAEPSVRVALSDWVIVSYVLAGVIAWWRRPDSRLGPLMVAAGFATFAGFLAFANSSFLHTVGEALDFLPPVLFLHVFLAYPSGRLQGRLERSFVVVAYGVALGLQLVSMMLDSSDAQNLISVAAEPGAADTAQQAVLYSLSALALAGIAALVIRRRRAGSPLRRSLDMLTDAFVLGLVMLALLFLSVALDGPGVETIRRVTFAVMGLAPLAYLVGLLHARLARAGVADLLIELREQPSPATLRDALARALRDPSVALAYWLPEFGSYGDLDGHPVELAIDQGRTMTPIERNGVHVAMLSHDLALRDEPELLAAVTAAAGIALENAQLQAELRARVTELYGSRARILEAGQKERQRLERNLHDGAQQRLIALSLELGLLEEELGDDQEAAARLDEARREIAISLEELRTIARGLHPAVVSGHGLEVGLEQLVALAPIPVRLTVAVQGRLPEPLEVATYYLVSESLANVGKYAQASSAAVDVTRRETELVIEVADDGVGGADTASGSGLRGLADRVETLGGRLRVWSPTGGGTRVRAEIPCES